ncbi:winged helix DNA-binding domain-containing protein [Paractinoplanes hotanensis]|uniref:Winged helix DNA-binding domain-containing protein n=1 Tax=Paractinoplanes hotanensis TaxID=2906497 RepID=A0ABT0YAR0_9ACTN|nr:winged helix DNA-binding domain-containing protein [Actinoplanes hotanensis]MCM4083131.1 winged helix DNA-binding domain-containing protein [Actinoplanes hotanensis]
MSRSLSWAQVHGRRLRRSGLLEPGPVDRLPEVARSVCGIQAQVMGAAEWALGVRAGASTVEQVRSLIWEQRQLVKAWSIRGTLHLMTAGDQPLWATAMLDHPSGEARHWHRQFGLDEAQGTGVLTAIADALDGRVLSREELAAAVTERLGPQIREPMMSHWGDMLAPAAYRGILCFGPSAGTKVSFARRDQWAAAGSWPYLGDALADAVLRYAAAYGPVSAADVGRWFAMRTGQARELLEKLADRFTTVDVAGTPGLVPADDDIEWDDDPDGVWLLPQYDPYVLGCGLRDRVVPRPRCERIFQHGRGRYEGAVAQNVLLVDGVVAGMWRRVVRRSRVRVTVEAFVPLTAADRERIAGRAAEMAAFHGAAPDVEFARLDAP